MTNNNENIYYTLPAVIRETARNKGNNKALSSLETGSTLTYTDAINYIDALIYFLEQHDIGQGDKIAILSNNMPNWGLAYFAITSMGAVVVPLLPEFSSKEIENTLQHSESKAVFVSSNLRRHFNNIHTPHLNYQFAIEDFSEINNNQKVNFNLSAKPKKSYLVEEEDLAAIIYTSGTTGSSKGVMLTHKNIVFNARQSGYVQSINENDRFLSILPLSHTYENTIGFILPVIHGAHIYYISKPPTPSILLPALKKVKPTIILTVPLIIEKIYNSKIKPTFTKNRATKYLYAVRPIRQAINILIGKRLKRTFGGELRFFGIGGAKLDSIVEKFLLEAKFPYAIGYGLTETSPLAAGVNPQTTRWQSTGPSIRDGQLKIHDPDPKTGEGEIWIKGPHVMKGYYKNPEKTNEVITSDGWFKSGDLGKFSKDGYLYIKGRLKNIIIGSSGENIYPEEIESIINNFNHVLESIVVEQKGKLIAKVHFNQQELEEKYTDFKEEVADYIEHKKIELRNELLNYVNNRVNRFSKLQMIQVYSEPFQKTATYKIKRFLYTH
ncbi:MAG: AMP-binding protein [Bacteroidales bacterium]|nr:AMP-binding protein [Bacteroidales bacterium]